MKKHGLRKPNRVDTGRGFLTLPATKLGWWSVVLAATFVVLFAINATLFIPATVVVPWQEVILPFYGVAMLLCGLAAGIVGLLAVTRHHERSWLVWVTMLPGLLVLFLVIGEFLGPPH